MNSEATTEYGLRDGGSPFERVLDAVVAAEGTDAPALDTPLFDVVDPDTLDALVGSFRRSSASVSFDYLGHRVTVGPGRIELAGRNGASPAEGE